jgi:cytochrome b561
VGERYGAVAQGFHWIVAVLVLGLFGYGLWMAGLPIGMERLRAVPLHKSFGVLLFVVVLARLAWRWTHPAPPLPASMRGWERRAAMVSHALLYVLLVAVPLSGWLMSSALGFGTVPFGLFQLPDVLSRDRALGDTLKNAHYFLNKALIALVLLHAAAALKHHFIDRDDVLQRMLPWKGRNA